jgi:hypothetical protein
MMRMKSHTRFPVGKLTILLAAGCLLLLLAGCGGYGKSVASVPVPTTVPTQTQRLRPSPALLPRTQLPDHSSRRLAGKILDRPCRRIEPVAQGRIYGVKSI